MAYFELADAFPDQARIKVIGVGGAGGNAVNTMIGHGVDGVEFITANTDVQALEKSRAPTRIQLGSKVTRGLGAGANPERGREAALESVHELAESLKGADMVFVTAGMGGGTGTGAAPIVAQVARECGALCVGVVTKPFRFEGRRRLRVGEEGIANLEKAVDTLITIPNDRLLDVTSTSTSLLDSFKLCDEVLQHATQGVSDLITIPGIINVDFADVRTIMSGQGRALMGMGFATDEGRAVAAAQQAINSPLLEDVTIQGARGILINITAGPDLKLHEVEEAASLIQEAAHEDCNIIFGAVIDEHMGEALRITVIATGFDQHMPAQDELEEIIRGHSGRRRQSQQMVATGTVGPGGRKEIVTAPMNSRQPGLFSSQQLAAQQAQQAVNRHHGAPSGSVLRGAAPEPQRPAHPSDRYMSSDPSEIPAFLRRRDENSGIGR
jgi:cell division protein FtsZ